ncbi:MAG TPA: SDR family oxidoreductase [Sporichthyaceae bacterium]|nr:SDR family oxidoreductase [Sporichthyaceae bacterium]
MVSLSGKVAIVTGGGSGMGRATSLLAAALGASVVVADLDGAKAEAVAKEIRGDGGQAIAIAADVTSAADNQAAVDLAVSTYGGLDVLVANAGLAHDPTPFEELSEALFEKVFAVNVRGPWLGARAAAPAMRKRGGGSIIVVGSIMGERARPGFSSYAPSKAASNHLAKTLALELAADNIRVNCLAPVATDTPMLASFIGAKNNYEEGKAKFIASIPLGRLATAEDIAEAAVYFASDEASFLTGVVLPIDGGRGI